MLSDPGRQSQYCSDFTIIFSSCLQSFPVIQLSGIAMSGFQYVQNTKYMLTRQTYGATYDCKKFCALFLSDQS